MPCKPELSRGETQLEFEKYVNGHVSEHSIMRGLKEHGYSGLNPRTEVRYLPDGIKATPQLDTVKTTVLASQEWYIDFVGCCHLYTDLIKQDDYSNPIKVSAIKTRPGGGRGIRTWIFVQLKSNFQPIVYIKCIQAFRSILSNI